MTGKKRHTAHHPIVGQFAAELRAARRRLGLSQYDLALKAKIAITYVGKLERGEAAPGLDMVARLAEALGVDVPTLVGAGGKRSVTKPDVAAGQLREQVERLIRRDAGEVVQALAVIVSAAEKGVRRERR